MNKFIMPQTKLIKMGDRLLDFWHKDTRLLLQSPVSNEDILEFEKYHKVTLPLDFKYYLLNLANGFDQNENYQDENGFNFLPLKCLYSVSKLDTTGFKSSNGRDYFIFCDYLDFCWAFGINLTEGGAHGNVVVVGAGNPFPIVSTSFLEFVELYLVDDARLYRF